MRYSVDSEVFSRFPSFKRMVVVAKDVNNSTVSPALEALLRQREAEVQGPELENFKTLPALKVWADTFTAMGLNPNRFPPSVINLIKRVRGGKALPTINPLVSLFNCISLKYLVPCGGDDKAVVKGDLRLGPAAGNEIYVPLGRPEERETPPAEEIIYYDTGNLDVFCRAWCWKNGDRSKIEPTTRDAIINIDAMLPVTQEHIRTAAAELAALVTEHTGATVTIYALTPETPEFEIAG